MLSTVWNRFVRTGALVSLAAFALASVAGAEPAPRPGRRALNLFASSGLLLEANRIQCGLDNVGQVCVAFSGSPVGGGGFWPKGTPDQYIFNSGLQLAGIVDPASGFSWAGDTAGAFFFDPRGDQGAGDALGSIYNSLDPADLNAWPNGAMVRDAKVYDEALLGQKRISDGDSWVRYWEGNPVQLGGRAHPMGIMVEQRSMAWNFPVGNEDIMYFVFTFYNVSAKTASKYSGLDPAIQGEVAAIGAQFQDLNETKFGIQIPDTGYTIKNLYAAFAMDADVAVFAQNYATAVLPFNLGTVYSGTFLPEVGWRFPSDIFGPPFFPGAGFIGVKYLRSPESSPGVEVGLTLFSNTTNSSQFPDAVGDHKLYRRLSGFLGGADETCTFTDPAVARARRLCFLAQAQDDARFYQASGPFDLHPGEAQTIVVAYIQAAPVAVTGVVPGADEKPGIPFTGDSIAADAGKIRRIDRVMGWVSQSDQNANNIIEQNEVVTTPRSLLNKALVAQAVFDGKFLLPNAPASPEFYLVPGDNQNTVVWQKSPTEDEEPCIGALPPSGLCGGDLFYTIASRPFNIDTVRDAGGAIVSIDTTRNALYDPNFRQFDVEGYRIYRGRTSSELQLLAQFDYSGTTFIDYTGAIAYGDENGDGLVQCAPELGLQADCPVVFDTSYVKTTGSPTELSGTVVQVKAGERVRLANGDVINLIADTAVSGGGRGFPALDNTGVLFAFVDNDVRNGFTYHYTVTAFDVNSVKSGPSSLESARVTKTVTPRASTPSETQAELVTGMFGDDNVALDPSAPFAIDAGTGEFSGPPPPTDALTGVFAPLVPQLLPVLSLVARVDSLSVRTDGDGGCPVSNGLGACYLIYVTFTKDGVPQSFVINQPWPVWTSFDGITNIVAGLGEVPVQADSASAARFGVPNGFSQFNATVSSVLREYIRFSSFEGQASRRGLISSAAPSFSPGGSRWFSGANESTVHPGLGIRVGHLPGVDTVWAPIHHTDTDPNTAGVQSYANSGELQCFGYGFAGLSREADVVFTWGAGGQIQSVRDVTHHVPEQFKPTYQASYGFVGDFNGNGYIDVRDFNYVDIAAQFFDDAAGPLGFCAFTDPGPAGRKALLQQPVLLPVSVEASPTAGSGTGFGLYINGERYIFRLTGGTPPSASTAWTLRTYAGIVRSSAASIQGPNPQGYTYTATDRNPIIPGLEVRFLVDQPTTFAANSDSGLSRIHTVPDPYYVSNALETTANQKVLQFVNLPMQAIVRIYSLSGVLVNVLTHNDQSGGGLLNWDLRNRNNQFVASGVYFYHVETPDGKTKVGRFTVVNFAP